MLFGNKSINFEIDQFKKCLTEGLDDIALSMEKINHINKFEKKINLSKPGYSIMAKSNSRKILFYDQEME